MPFNSPQDINTLLVATRELNRKVPKGGNGLGGLGNFGGLGGFGIKDLESMGLPESGDMIANVDGVPHIRTSFGKQIIFDLYFRFQVSKQIITF